MSGLIKEILESDFDKETNQGMVLIDFFADWCGPCRQLTPVLEEVARDVKEVKFVKMNVDNAQQTASDLDVSSIPTLILFKDGTEVNRVIGLIDAEGLKAFLETAK